MSTFYNVADIVEKNVSETEIEGDIRYLLIGDVVAKSDDRESLTRLLNRFDVEHKNLPNNKIGGSFKVADIGAGLDEFVVKSADRIHRKLAEI